MRVWRRWLAMGGLMLVAARAAGAQEAKSGAFTLPPPANAVEAMRLTFYAYDRSLPLNAKLKPLDETAQRRRIHLTYMSAHDQRVTAILALPKRFAAPYPVALLAHGSGGHKDTSYILWVSELLTSLGYATLSLDTQYHGERARTGRSGDIHLPDSYTMRDAWVQSVIDLRRAVDYLETRPDIQKEKIGYMGFSQGAMLGCVLGGVESRVAAFCLAVPGGGLTDIVKNLDRYPLIKARWPVTVTPDLLERVEEIANITDPIHFVGRIAPRPLLILVAEKDEIIPPEASAALVKAAGAKEGEQVKRWVSGHALNPNALFDIRKFFTAHFGRRAPLATAAR